MALGDYSITYKIGGMLTAVKSLLTACSNLCRHVLDALHEGGVEIVSPAFMNQRKLADDLKIIPVSAKIQESESLSSVEEVVFDKAEQAEQLDKDKQALLDKIEAAKTAIEGWGSGEVNKRSKEAIHDYLEQLKTIDTQSAEAMEEKS